LLKPQSRDNYAAAINLLERALTLDPRSVEVQSRLATALAARVIDERTDTAAVDILRAEDLAGQALAAAPRSTLAHFAKGQVLRAQRRPEQAISEYEAVLALDRNWVSAYSLLGWCKLWTGSVEEAIPLQEQAIRLSPRDPQIGIWHRRIGMVHLLQSRFDDAIIWFEKSSGGGLPHLHSRLASAYALKGETERAIAELAEARRLSYDERYSSIDRLKVSGYRAAPKIQALLEATYFAGLRKAGMPEE
jgi:tetratricopeptide (TPR) repeat protein